VKSIGTSTGAPAVADVFAISPTARAACEGEGLERFEGVNMGEPLLSCPGAGSSGFIHAATSF
jgi:hypothetical protein